MTELNFGNRLEIRSEAEVFDLFQDRVLAAYPQDKQELVQVAFDSLREDIADGRLETPITNNKEALAAVDNWVFSTLSDTDRDNILEHRVIQQQRGEKKQLDAAENGKTEFVPVPRLEANDPRVAILTRTKEDLALLEEHRALLRVLNEGFPDVQVPPGGFLETNEEVFAQLDNNRVVRESVEVEEEDVSLGLTQEELDGLDAVINKIKETSNPPADANLAA